MKRIAVLLFSIISKQRPEKGEDDMVADKLTVFQELFAKDMARRQKQVDQRARGLRRRGNLRRHKADLFR